MNPAGPALGFQLAQESRHRTFELARREIAQTAKMFKSDVVLVPNAAISYAESQASGRRSAGAGGQRATSGGGKLATVLVVRSGNPPAPVPVE